ncbi:hypothetical protein BDN72DRAFT_865291 [Pluteus cervinus]|uniref:Uncharacterized protein n=1 Tax=Pluteus cervinus TaxID=181527 RepID=A0ACD3A097_9AGAR|nr:hypothetical protein BDN72DRAFT_865291 [Pluteus cervinus]
MSSSPVSSLPPVPQPDRDVGANSLPPRPRRNVVIGSPPPRPRRNVVVGSPPPPYSQLPPPYSPQRTVTRPNANGERRASRAVRMHNPIHQPRPRRLIPNPTGRNLVGMLTRSVPPTPSVSRAPSPTTGNSTTDDEIVIIESRRTRYAPGEGDGTAQNPFEIVEIEELDTWVSTESGDVEMLSSLEVEISIADI